MISGRVILFARAQLLFLVASATSCQCEASCWLFTSAPRDPRLHNPGTCVQSIWCFHVPLTSHRPFVKHSAFCTSRVTGEGQTDRHTHAIHTVIELGANFYDGNRYQVEYR